MNVRQRVVNLREPDTNIFLPVPTINLISDDEMIPVSFTYRGSIAVN